LNFLSILPMAVVMIAGPQIITAIVLATGRDPWRTSLAYLAGAGVAVLVGVTIAYGVISWLIVATGGRGGGKGYVGTAIDGAVLALLVVLMVIVFRWRHRWPPPVRRGGLEAASPGAAVRLGVGLLLPTPRNIITMITVSASMARHDRPWWHLLPFLLLTLLLLALPLLSVSLLGHRATRVLPTIRDWTDDHSWLVSEFAIVFFLGVTVSSLLG
jgi:hypothetical protein